MMVLARRTLLGLRAQAWVDDSARAGADRTLKRSCSCRPRRRRSRAAPSRCRPAEQKELQRAAAEGDDHQEDAAARIAPSGGSGTETAQRRRVTSERAHRQPAAPPEPVPELRPRRSQCRSRRQWPRSPSSTAAEPPPAPAKAREPAAAERRAQEPVHDVSGSGCRRRRRRWSAASNAAGDDPRRHATFGPRRRTRPAPRRAAEGTQQRSATRMQSPAGQRRGPASQGHRGARPRPGRFARKNKLGRHEHDPTR